MRQYLKRLLCAILNRACPCNKCECEQGTRVAAERSRAKRYTKPQWKAMSPTERIKLGLPRRSLGVQFKN